MISNIVVKKTAAKTYEISWHSSSLTNSETVAIYLLDHPDQNTGKLLLQTQHSPVNVTVHEYLRPYFLIKTSSQICKAATRVIPLTGSNNFRDLGGYQTKDHRFIKWGKIFRSDHLHRLSASDKKVLEEIGIKTVIDYRREDEYEKQPNQTWKTLQKTFHLVPEAQRAVLAAKAGGTKEKVRQLVQHEVDQNVTFDNSGRTMIEQAKDFVRLPQNQKIYRKMLEVVLNEANIPTDQHCRGGKDRTGYGIALILTLLGVDQKTIIADYMLTKTLRLARNKHRMAQYAHETNDQNVLAYLYSMLDTRPEYLQASFDEMVVLAGSVPQYFKNILKITASDQALLKHLYLES